MNMLKYRNGSTTIQPKLIHSLPKSARISRVGVIQTYVSLRGSCLNFCTADRERGAFRLWFVLDKTRPLKQDLVNVSLSADCKGKLCWCVQIEINSPFPRPSVTPLASDGAFELFKRCTLHFTGYFQVSLWSTQLFHYGFSTVSIRQCEMLPSFCPDGYLYQLSQHPSAGMFLPCLDTAVICHQESQKSRLFSDRKLELNPQRCVRHHAKLSHQGKLQ